MIYYCIFSCDLGGGREEGEAFVIHVPLWIFFLLEHSMHMCLFFVHAAGIIARRITFCKMLTKSYF